MLSGVRLSAENPCRLSSLAVGFGWWRSKVKNALLHRPVELAHGEPDKGARGCSDKRMKAPAWRSAPVGPNPASTAGSVPVGRLRLA